jgi:hypothetical protein
LFQTSFFLYLQEILGYIFEALSLAQLNGVLFPCLDRLSPLQCWWCNAAGGLHIWVEGLFGRDVWMDSWMDGWMNGCIDV